MIDLAKLACAPIDKVGRAAMGVIDRLQLIEKEVQAAAFGMAFLAFCKHNKVLPGACLQVAQRMLDDTPNHTAEIKGVRQYIGEQVT